jgi:hypothetical protein
VSSHEEEGPAAAPAGAPAAKDDEAKPEADAEPKAEPPQVDFVTFVLSLATNAMGSLGLVPRGDGKATPPDLPLARQTIDILALLQDRMRGNLTGEEERILETVLYDLRMTYVRVASGRG